MKDSRSSIARRVAFDVLLRVETADAFASDLLHAKLVAKPSSAISPEDAGLATELTLGVLRWQRRLDITIASLTKNKRLDAPVQIALRMGAYQLLFLDRIPPHAAVNESVELVKKAGVRSAAGMVNAVLRKLAQSGARKDDLPPLPRKASLAEQLAIRCSHPTWLVERWLARFGEDNTSALLAANNAPAPAVVSILSGDAHLSADSPGALRLEPGSWLKDAHRLAGSGELLPRRRESIGGRFHFQDEASQMVAHLLDVRPGQRVLDLCAAPGGKTLPLARAAGQDGRVFGGDLHLHRLGTMRARLTESGLKTPIHLMALDATQPLPFAEKFDRVLVDAPCSGTGTLARNPEIRWRLSPQDLVDLAARQKAILSNALDALAPGGRLLYSTCSLEREENEEVVESVLATKTGFRLADGRPAVEPHLRADADLNRLFDLPLGSNTANYFRTFPPAHHTDGFFAAIIEKSA